MSNWFSERVSAVTGALGDRGYRVPLAAKGALGLVALVALTFFGHKMTIANYAFGSVAIISLVMFWWLLEHVVVLRRRLTPRLEIEFEPKRPWISRVEDSHIPIPGNTANRAPSLWFSVRVASTLPDRPAKGCLVKLVTIEYSPNGIGYEDVIFASPQILRWAWTPQVKESSPADIGVNAPKTVDVISVDPVHNKLFIKWERDAEWITNAHVTDRIGFYRLTIVAASDEGAPVRKRLVVKWTGQWDQTTMEMEKD